MCLILFSISGHPRYRLILAANRDEFYDRPTAPAHFWQNKNDILAGRDLKASGTWLGVTLSGRFAALTNYREFSKNEPQELSRGLVVRNFLESRTPSEYFLTQLEKEAHRYGGFNLLVGEKDRFYFFSNRELGFRQLSKGIYGLSNHLLNTPWPKVTQGIKKFSRALKSSPTVEPETFFQMLSDDQKPSDNHLPDTGIGLEWERILSPIFIQSPTYGTRSSTVLLWEHSGKIRFFERNYDLRQPVTREFFISDSHAG